MPCGCVHICTKTALYSANPFVGVCGATQIAVCETLLAAMFRFGVLSAINEDEEEEEEDAEKSDNKGEQSPSREEVDAAIKMVRSIDAKA